MTLSQRRFTLDSINVVTNWQGSVVYDTLIGLSLLMINRRQLNIAQLNRQSLEPVRVTFVDLIRFRLCLVMLISSKPCGRWRWLANRTWTG